MFKSILTLTLTMIVTALMPTQTFAWEQHMLPTSFSQSSTAHYGGNKAPLVLSPSHIMLAAANTHGMQIWSSHDDGINWISSPLHSSLSTSITQAYLANDRLALGWSHETVKQYLLCFITLPLLVAGVLHHMYGRSQAGISSM